MLARLHRLDLETKIPRLPYGRFPWKFEYRPEDHDDGLKTFLGHTGNFNGEDIIDIIVTQPACAKFICRHLYNFFVPMSHRYRRGRSSLRAIRKRSLNSPLCSGRRRATSSRCCVTCSTRLVQERAHYKHLNRRPKSWSARSAWWVATKSRSRAMANCRCSRRTHGQLARGSGIVRRLIVRGHECSVAEDQPGTGVRRDPSPRSDDADQVERVAGLQAYHFARSFAPTNVPQGVHGFGEAVLLADEAGPAKTGRRGRSPAPRRAAARGSRLARAP